MNYHPDCTCGQEKSGKCTRLITVSNVGVLSQTAEGILMCGQAKQQMEAAKEVMKWQKRNNK